MLVVFAKIFPAKWRSNLVYKLPGERHTYTRLREADTTKNVDVLILGSSHAYTGYDPRIFKQHGWKVFNLGTTAQSFIQTDLLLRRYINQFKPKYIIFDIYPALFSNDGVESGLDIVSNTRFKSDIFKMAIALSNIKVYNTLIYSLYMQKFEIRKSYRAPLKNVDGAYIKGGYVENYKMYNTVDTIEKNVYKIHENQLNAFKDIIQLIKQRKIPYVLVQAPITKAAYNSIGNNNTIDSMLRKYGTYFNSNEGNAIPINYFKDASHLNQYGVNVFDNNLIKVIGTSIQNAVGH